MLSDLKRRQTLASFDYQWGSLTTGDAMLDDPWFVERVDGLLADELLGIRREWFPGRRVLDAGCGGGRWTVGFLRLGAQVTSVDFSAHAVETTRAEARRLVPGSEARLVARRADLLADPAELGGPYDLVYSFGVLHHTGDTRRALAHVAGAVAPDGVLFVYLYGTRSVDWRKRAVLTVLRTALAPLPFAMKTRALKWLLPSRDVHQAFDLFSPVINDRYRHEEVEGWLRELGFTEVARTLDHTEVFLRACREVCSAGPFLPPATRPYWFERYAASKPTK